MRKERVEILKELEKERKSKVIAYITGDRNGAEANIGEDAVRPMYEHLLKLKEKPKQIDLVLYSRGGDVSVPWKIVTMVREFCEVLNVLVPYKAHSATTMICLGADNIVMGPKAELGPIDPSLTMRTTGEMQKQINTEDVSSYISFMKERVNLNDQAALSHVISQLAEDVTPLTLGTINRNYSHIRLVAKKLLSARKEKMDENKIQSIIEALTEKMYSHGHAIGRREAKEIGLPVEFAKKKVEELIWKLYISYEEELELEKPMHYNALLEDKEKEVLKNVKIALIESIETLHIYEYDLNITKVRQIPQSPQINVNLSLNLPAGVDVAQIPQETQRIVQEMLQEATPHITEQVREEIVRQSPELDVQIKGLKGGWDEKRE